MILKLHSVRANGEVTESEEIEVTSFAEASARLVESLYETASDQFLTDALQEWFTTRKIDMLDETCGDAKSFWNASLSDS